MAFTYLILNLAFVACACVLLYKWLPKPTKTWWITCASLLSLTLVFDNLAIGLGLVLYDPDLILGVRIGVAPIEDFFYTILACIIVPALWRLFEPNAQKATGIQQ